MELRRQNEEVSATNLRRAVLCFGSLLLFGCQLAFANIDVPHCTIIVQPGARPEEKFAARELRDHLSKIVGVQLPLKEASIAPNNSIVVGTGRLAKSIAPEVQISTLTPEETWVVCSGHKMLVTGGVPRGVLYSVYRLLQEKCGVRWWAPWASTIPANPHLTFSSMNWTEKPAFEYRDPLWHHSFNADWAARNFDNGANTAVDETRGGKTVFQGWVHTYYALVPPAKYLALHPEWYSLIGGKRTTENAQLCTTNPQLRDFVVEEVRRQLRSNPEATIISVSQNDCYNPCQCPVCRALAAKEGSDSALVLDLANYVADHIRKEFPNVAVDTLAYQWSRHPPKTMRPRENVIVRLCSIECDFAHPLFARQNQAFAADLTGWHALTDRLYVWDYCTDFLSYLQPQPDYFTLGPTLSWFSQNGVKGVFEEGDYSSNGGDMAELKAWVIAQMLWDPKQDPNHLVEVFLKGYYGPASLWVRRYLDLMSVAADPYHSSFAMDETAPFLSYKVMSQAMVLWQSALQAVAGSQYESRVRMSMLSPQLVWLVKWNGFRTAADKEGDPWPWVAGRGAAADDWLRTARTSAGISGYEPVTAVNEQGLTSQKFEELIRAGQLQR